MAKRNPHKREQMNAGDTFAVPLPDGRYGACRVVQATTDEQFQKRNVLVAGLAWIGEKPPPLTEPRLRLLLRLTVHDSAGQPLLFWVRQDVPKTLRYLGVLPPSATEAAMGHMIGQMDWDAFIEWISSQWKADEAQGLPPARDEAELRRRQNEAARRHSELRRRTAREELLGGQSFADLDEYHEDEIARAFRQVLRKTLATLQELGPDGDEVAKLDALRLFIERLNEYEEEIDTIDREVICDVFDHLVWFAGLEDYGTDLQEPPWRAF